MTDNINIKDATGRSVAVSTEDISQLNGEVVASQHIQRTASTYISGSGSAVDGSQPLTDTQLRASAVPVSVSGVSTSDKQDTLLSAVQALQTAVGLLAKLTDTQPVSGTVTANTGLTQPLTDTQLRATAVPVSGTFYQATQPVSGTVTANTGISQPLTDTELRASNVGVSLPVDGDGANLICKVLLYDDAGESWITLPSINGKVAVNIDSGDSSIAIGSIANGMNIIAKELTDFVYTSANVPMSPKFAVISAGTSGNNTIVAAVANKKIRVLALTLSFSDAVNAKFQSGASGTDKTGLFYGTTNTQIVLPYNKLGWFETAASALLNLNLSGAVPVGGCLTYIEV
jgi:hypothetical protein